MKFTATKPTKYKGVWYQAGDEFDVDAGRDETVAGRHFKATPVTKKKPARHVLTTRAMKVETAPPEPQHEPLPEPAPFEPLAADEIASVSVPKRAYHRRDQKAED